MGTCDLLKMYVWSTVHEDCWVMFPDGLEMYVKLNM